MKASKYLAEHSPLYDVYKIIDHYLGAIHEHAGIIPSNDIISTIELLEEYIQLFKNEINQQAEYIKMVKINLTN